jgi:uncharacterized membrane protein
MELRPLLFIFLLYVLYRRIPQIVPRTARLARWGVITVAVLITPYAVYSVAHGFSSWSLDQPIWLLVLMGMAGVGTFVLFTWASIVLFVDAKRTP